METPTFLVPVKLVSPVGPMCLVLKCKSRVTMRGFYWWSSQHRKGETNTYLTLTADLSLPTAMICTLPRCRMAARILKTSIWKSSLKPENKIFPQLGILHFFSCSVTSKINTWILSWYSSTTSAKSWDREQWVDPRENPVHCLSSWTCADTRCELYNPPGFPFAVAAREFNTKISIWVTTSCQVPGRTSSHSLCVLCFLDC